VVFGIHQMGYYYYYYSYSFCRVEGAIDIADLTQLTPYFAPMLHERTTPPLETERRAHQITQFIAILRQPIPHIYTQIPHSTMLFQHF
jgi:hypothetical protein